MSFKWTDNYKTDIEEIDKQYKKLFEIGGQIYELAILQSDYSNSDYYDDIMKILEELKEYTIYHFGYEETLMMRYNFKEYENHKIEHDFFIKKIDKINKMDIDNDQNKAILEIINFVSEWIRGHIQNTDKNYIGCFRSNGM